MQIEVVIGLLLAMTVIMFNGLHQVPQGYVAVYYRGGALLNWTAGPGWNTKIPGITTYEIVQVTVQTDKVDDVPCGTSGGVLIYFKQIEVVNRLREEYALETVKNYTINYDKTWIYDKIHHEINQFCSKNSLQEVFIDKFDMLDEQLAETLQETASIWAPGIEIISVRITKPQIPATLQKNYEDIEKAKTAFKIAEQEQRVTEQKAETKKREEMIKAQAEAEISKIEMTKQVHAKEALKRMEEIENEIYLLREQSKADAHHYKIMKMIESEQTQLSPQYLQKLAIESFTTNTKLYFGESIPKFISENIQAMDGVAASQFGAKSGGETWDE